MFQMIKCASVPDVSKIREEYEIDGTELSANVSAEHLQSVFESFLSRMADVEPLFLYIEVPVREEDELKLNPPDLAKKSLLQQGHRDVYYLDGYTRETMTGLLKSPIGELLINDGLVSFGFGSLQTNIELGKSKYNVMNGYFMEPEDAKLFEEIFDELRIPRVEKTTPAWQQFTPENPGKCWKYDFDGKDVYELIEDLKELGLYKAETREES